VWWSCLVSFTYLRFFSIWFWFGFTWFSLDSFFFFFMKF
jgi:hypothetical protein